MILCGMVCVAQKTPLCGGGENKLSNIFSSIVPHMQSLASTRACLHHAVTFAEGEGECMLEAKAKFCTVLYTVYKC